MAPYLFGNPDGESQAATMSRCATDKSDQVPPSTSRVSRSFYSPQNHGNIVRRVPFAGPYAPCGRCGRVTRTWPALHGCGVHLVLNLFSSSAVNILSLMRCTNDAVDRPRTSRTSSHSLMCLCIPGKIIVQSSICTSSRETVSCIMLAPRPDFANSLMLMSICRKKVLSLA
jgi:hypothetical protein